MIRAIDLFTQVHRYRCWLCGYSFRGSLPSLIRALMMRHLEHLHPDEHGEPETYYEKEEPR